ncbi:DUF4062 domain-containing protein [Nostoc favosum]|uniref:DUF4062 domain-containing protein n=1 Tax=Nostoc favosum CHAB5714 TaxID=2780399 RepID=A0ABS8INH1_9NOSO|nr:DUF4062 domain-containing protein [Nostoc favosum]MCC5605176.1 DUF4062 domain-containing protein [Nostoc favosum CHAB5714]
MAKKYQMFISSTFADLVGERQAVVKTILDLEQIPSGMEVFPAVDQEQFEYIKKVIDECDYYILIIGARYGSTDQSGVSFTELEYDYAVQQRKTVLAFLHGAPETIPVKNVDQDPQLAERLAQFRTKVSRNRLVKYWTTPDSLQHAVAISIVKAISSAPAIGWIRGDAVASEELLKQINQIRIERDALKERVTEEPEETAIPAFSLASLDDLFEIRLIIAMSYGVEETDSVEMSWIEIFRAVAPSLGGDSSIHSMRDALEIYIRENKLFKHGAIYKTDFDKIRVHLEALGLLEVKFSEGLNHVVLTKKGRATMLDIVPAQVINF